MNGKKQISEHNMQIICDDDPFLLPDILFYLESLNWMETSVFRSFFAVLHNFFFKNYSI